MEETIVVEEEQKHNQTPQEETIIVEPIKTTKRSIWKTLGVKIWILLMIIFGIAGFCFIAFTSLLIKPNVGFDINSSTNLNLLKNPDLYYWNNGKFTTCGIIASVVMGIEFILITTTLALYNKLTFVIGKKGNFTGILIVLLIFTLVLYIVGMLGKPDLFKNLLGNGEWKWLTITWEINTTGTTVLVEPTIIWWGMLIISCVGIIVIVSLFIVFLIKFIFARSHDK